MPADTLRDAAPALRDALMAAREFLPFRLPEADGPDLHAALRRTWLLVHNALAQADGAMPSPQEG